MVYGGGFVAPQCLGYVLFLPRARAPAPASASTQRAEETTLSARAARPPSRFCFFAFCFFAVCFDARYDCFLFDARRIVVSTVIASRCETAATRVDGRYGVEGDYNILVLDILGPSLEDLFGCGPLSSCRSPQVALKLDCRSDRVTRN